MSWLLVGLLCFTASAQADDEVRVLIVAATVEGPMVVRLGAELEGLGLTPIVVSEQDLSPITSLSLTTAAEQRDAVAAFSVTATSVQLVVPGPNVTAELRDLGISSADPFSASMLGVRAGEVLRAGLMAARADAVSTRTAQRMSIRELAEIEAVSRPPTVALAAGPLVGRLASAPELVADLRLAIPLRGPVMAVAGLALPVSGVRMEGDAGQARLTTKIFQAGSRFVLIDRQLGADLTAGVAALRLRTAGRSTTEATEQVVGAWRWAPWSSAGVSWDIQGGIRLRSEVQVEVFSPARIHLADEVVQWGPVQTRAVVGVEIDLDLR